MGYRSDVAYTIRFVDNGDGTRARQSFFTFLAEAKNSEATAGCFGEDEAEYLKVYEDKMMITFKTDDVKWYPEYPEVARHMSLISLAKNWIENKDADGVIGYAYVCVGEEANDITEDYGGNWDSDWCFVSRQIITDWD